MQNDKSEQRLSDKSFRTRPGQIKYDKANPPSVPPPAQLSATLEQQKPRAEIFDLRTFPTSHSEVPRNQTPLPNHNTEMISREHRYEKDILTDRMKALEEQIELLQKDNDLLRSAIVQKGKDSQPLRGEEYYARLFKELKAEIETWMARQAKTNGSQELSAGTERTLLENLANFGRRGQWSAEFLNTNGFFQAWYANTRSRIQLGRHIVAAILFDEVFSPFAFGLPDEWAKAMAWVEKDNNSGLPLMNLPADLFRAPIQSGSYGSSVLGPGVDELRAQTLPGRRTYPHFTDGGNPSTVPPEDIGTRSSKRDGKNG